MGFDYRGNAPLTSVLSLGQIHTARLESTVLTRHDAPIARGSGTYQFGAYDRAIPAYRNRGAADCSRRPFELPPYDESTKISGFASGGRHTL
jgi:hypothetical protein